MALLPCKRSLIGVTMPKQLAVALILTLAACNSSSPVGTRSKTRIEPDSRRASHCYAAHDFGAEQGIRQNPPPGFTNRRDPKHFDNSVRALWQYNRFRASATPQVEEEQVIALTKQMLRFPETAAVLVRECSRLEDRDPEFHRAKKDIIEKLLEPPSTIPITLSRQ